MFKAPTKTHTKKKTQLGDSAVLVTFLCSLLGGHQQQPFQKGSQKTQNPGTLNNKFFNWMFGDVQPFPV